MRQSIFVMFVTFCVGYAACCTAAASVSPEQILTHADDYNGKVVSVTGIVQDFRDRVSRRGNAYETFELCGVTTCLHVFAWGDDQHDDGDRDTVSGHFWTVKRVGRYTFYDELDVDSGG